MNAEPVDGATLFLDQQGDLIPWPRAKRNFERQYVRAVLSTTGGNIADAARIAGKERKDFYHLMERCNVDPEEFRG